MEILQIKNDTRYTPRFPPPPFSRTNFQENLLLFLDLFQKSPAWTVMILFPTVRL